MRRAQCDAHLLARSTPGGGHTNTHTHTHTLIVADPATHVELDLGTRHAGTLRRQLYGCTTEYGCRSLHWYCGDTTA